MEKLFKTPEELSTFINETNTFIERFTTITKMYNNNVKFLRQVSGDITSWKVDGDYIILSYYEFNPGRSSHDALRIKSDVLFMDYDEIINHIKELDNVIKEDLEERLVK